MCEGDASGYRPLFCPQDQLISTNVKEFLYRI